MANPRFHLRNETDRQRAIAILQRVDLTEGKTWSLHDEARSDAQNRRMWAMLRDISQQVEWYGRKLDDELEAHLQRGGTATGRCSRHQRRLRGPRRIDPQAVKEVVQRNVPGDGVLRR